MLIKKAEQLIELSEERTKLHNYAEQLDGFNSRQGQINQAVAEIYPLVSALRAFRQKGVVTCDLIPKAEQLLEFVTTAEEKFKENPEWIINKDDFKGNRFDKSVKSLTNTLKQQLLQAWKNYLARPSRMPSSNQEVLNLLARIDAFKLLVQKIRNLDALIPREEFPKSCEEFENIDRLIDQLRESWNSLNSDEVPDAVRDFLKAAANQGAPLTLLTPEVQEWIARHGISDSLRIRLT